MLVLQKYITRNILPKPMLWNTILFKYYYYLIIYWHFVACFCIFLLLQRFWYNVFSQKTYCIQVRSLMLCSSWLILVLPKKLTHTSHFRRPAILHTMLVRNFCSVSIFIFWFVCLCYWSFYGLFIIGIFFQLCCFVH